MWNNCAKSLKVNWQSTENTQDRDVPFHEKSTGFRDRVVENAGNRMPSTAKGIDLLETVITENAALSACFSQWLAPLNRCF
jgi:hypothetical protein